MKKIDLNLVNWEEIQKKHNEGVFWNNISKICGISRTILERGERENRIIKILHKKVMSDEEKNCVRIGRIKYLKENPDKHPWKKNDKFKSKPCEKFKKMLIDNDIYFIDEYQPSDDRFYSIDVAFPNKKFGIEINGNQHYNNDGTLKE